jgi:hypothetical protein
VPSFVSANVLRQELQRDGSVEAGVLGLVDLPHPPSPEWSQNLVRAKACPRRQRHAAALQGVVPTGGILQPVSARLLPALSAGQREGCLLDGGGHLEGACRREMLRSAMSRRTDSPKGDRQTDPGRGRCSHVARDSLT